MDVKPKFCEKCIIYLEKKFHDNNNDETMHCLKNPFCFE